MFCSDFFKKKWKWNKKLKFFEYNERKNQKSTKIQKRCFFPFTTYTAPTHYRYGVLFHTQYTYMENKRFLFKKINKTAPYLNGWRKSPWIPYNIEIFKNISLDPFRKHWWNNKDISVHLTYLLFGFNLFFFIYFLFLPFKIHSEFYYFLSKNRYAIFYLIDKIWYSFPFLIESFFFFVVKY